MTLENNKCEEIYPSAALSENILVLVNKTHPVANEYVPADLIPVALKYRDRNMQNTETGKMCKNAAAAFEELCTGAMDSGYSILMRTGYRSYSYQKELYENYVSRDGEENANLYSAKPGQSEHQTGLSCDVGLKDRSLEEFGGTEEAKWLAENAWKYGFILRFPEGKSDITGYMYEPWHIRYVGKEPAKVIYEHKWAFEEYLEKTE